MSVSGQNRNQQDKRFELQINNRNPANWNRKQQQNQQQTFNNHRSSLSRPHRHRHRRHPNPSPDRRGGTSSSSAARSASHHRQHTQQTMMAGSATEATDLQFETPFKIVEYPDPILRAKNKRINTFDDNLKKLVDEMIEVMYKTDGIGLSAPQVGINVQLMVFNPVGEQGEGEEIVLVNPTVTNYSKKLVLFNEGCLSFPKIYADVERPESVKIDARDVTGARLTFNLSGLPARVFQHEFDHLQGVLFFDRMSEEVLDSVREQLQALEKKYEDKTGLLTPEKVETRQGKRVAAGSGKS